MERNDCIYFSTRNSEKDIIEILKFVLGIDTVEFYHAIVDFAQCEFVSSFLINSLLYRIYFSGFHYQHTCSVPYSTYNITSY